MPDLFWLIVIVIFVMWLAGMIVLPGVSLIHVLLVIILIIVAYRLLTRRGL